MTTDMTIYLIEDNNSPVSQALRNYQQDKAAMRQA